MFNYGRVVARARYLSGGMHKKADGGFANDALGAAITGQIPIVGPLANFGGTIGGIIGGKPTEEELKEMDKHPGRSWIPGVGAYRTWKKTFDTVQNDRPRETVFTETLGPVLQAAIGAAAGKALGGSPLSTIAGAGIAVAPQVLGMLIGLARKRRTAREQAEADANHSSLAALLLPGYAGYSSARRMPSMARREDERNRRAEEEQDKQK